MNYLDFLASKRFVSEPVGFEPRMPINSNLFGYQAEITLWALRRGRAALFMDTGTGKTIIELEWADHVQRHTKKPVLILTPLAVGPQMVRESVKFDIGGTSVYRPGIDKSYTRICVVNYEKLHLLNPEHFGGIVCDESSILKSFSGSTRKALTDFAKGIPYRLCATATPAPNDLIELTNHADFLDIMTGKEVIALFFTQDGNSAQKFRLKRHAEGDYWRWLASWSVALRKPSDLGHSDEGFVLPGLSIEHVQIEAAPTPGYLFTVEARGLAAQRAARRGSMEQRVEAVAELVAREPDEPWVIWCELNKESEALTRAIPGAVEVTGSMKDEAKEAALEGFASGKHRVVVSKAQLTGFGLNWQHCARMAFVGPSNSFEQTYQAIRRCHRFGQKRPVKVFVVASESDGEILANIRRKEAEANRMFDEIVRHMKGLSLGKSGREEMAYEPRFPVEVPGWMTSRQPA